MIGFGTTDISKPGVSVGSVRSLSGPLVGILPCGAGYSAAAGVQTYRISFSVARDSASSCHY